LDAAYVHYTPNETIEGVEFPYVPETGGVPLVADMSSTLLSRPIDVSRYGLIYAGAQKNIGPAGLTIVIVREDLIGQPLAGTPTMFDYKTHADNDSMYNTPPTYAWYLAGLVFQWLKDLGGPGGDGGDQRAQGRGALRRHRRLRLLRQPGGARLALLDERPLHPGRSGAGRDLPQGGQGRG
jgi:hypothetical protein